MYADNNMLFFGIIVLGISLMILGHSKRMGIFNLLSIPFWVFLAMDLLPTIPVLAVSFIGLIIFEFYWGLWGINE